MFPVSVMATAGILFFAAAATNPATPMVDCKTENCV